MLSLHSLVAQPSFRFRNFTRADGFPDNWTGGSIQDGMGFMWFSHQSYLSRFDGYRFKIYRHSPDDSLLNLGQRLLGSPFVDYQGNIWINNLDETWADHCLLKYDRNLDGFVRYKPDVGNARIRFVYVDEKEPIVWLGARLGAGLFKFDLRTHQTIHYSNTLPEPREKDQTNNILRIQCKGKELILFTRNGMWIMNKNTGQFRRPSTTADSRLMSGSTYWLGSKNGLELFLANLNEVVLLTDSSLRTIKEWQLPKDFAWSTISVTNGQIWFATFGNGLFTLDTLTNKFIQTRHEITNRLSLLSDYIWDVTHDRDENIWISSPEGISKMAPSSIHFTNQFVLPAGKQEGNAIISSLILGSGNHQQLLAFGEGYEMWTSSPNTSQPIKSFTYQIQSDKKGNLTSSSEGKDFVWVGAWDLGVLGFRKNSIGVVEDHHPIVIPFKSADQKSLQSAQVESVFEDRNGLLWVGFSDGLDILGVDPQTHDTVLHFKHDDKDASSMVEGFVRRIIQLDGNLLALATDMGVDIATINLKDRTVQFKHVFKDKEPVSDIVMAPDGSLFVGCLGGIYKGTRRGNDYAFSRAINLPEGIYGRITERSMAVDKYGRVWMASSLGLLCFDPISGALAAFSEEDGTSGTGLSLVSSPSGLMVHNSHFGTSTFDPSTFTFSTRKTIPVLTRLEVNNRMPIVGPRLVDKDDFQINKDITVLDTLTLDYQHNNFLLEFSAMELVDVQSNFYRYGLEGYDPDWIQTDYLNRTAKYTNLPSGDYTFRVKASNHHGVWCDNERILRVTILPPPWRTWWAYTGYGLMFFGLLYWGRWNLLRQERLKTSLQMAEVEKEKEHFELEKAKEVDRAKTSFFTNISHEFRTPLTLIKGPVEDMLEQFKDEPRLKERLKLIQRNSDLLLKLVNQLLDLA
ncbi:MAG: hypothetical protein JST14_08750, partial [Bacteroidetes bacterium]|nr:hypothetical protein [Bacteroidota bacterium]